MTDRNQNPEALDSIFKALGHVTRRRILRLLAQRPHYPYELSKYLGFTSRVIIKHLEVLQNAGLVETEAGEKSLGPERTYYKLRAGFGLSTTILPNSFAIHLNPRTTRITRIRTSIRIPTIRNDVRAVKLLLGELKKIDRQIASLEDKRMELMNHRGIIIRKIEEIMHECSWDDESCRLVRSHINPVDVADDVSDEEPLEKVLDLFEKRLNADDSKGKKENQEVNIEFE